MVGQIWFVPAVLRGIPMVGELPITFSGESFWTFALLTAGLLAVVIGQFWLILIILRGNPLAALLCCCVPFLVLFFIQEHWDVAKAAALIWLGGFSLMLLGVLSHYFVV